MAPVVSGDWSTFAFGQDGVFAELKSAVEKGLSKAGLMLFMQLDQGAILRKDEINWFKCQIGNVRLSQKNRNVFDNSWLLMALCSWVRTLRCD